MFCNVSCYAMAYLQCWNQNYLNIDILQTNLHVTMRTVVLIDSMCSVKIFSGGGYGVTGDSGETLQRVPLNYKLISITFQLNWETLPYPETISGQWPKIGGHKWNFLKIFYCVIKEPSDSYMLSIWREEGESAPTTPKCMDRHPMLNA